MRTISIAAIIATCLIGHSIAAQTSAPDVMLFSYFRDNGKDGVFLATSEDGSEFKALNDDKPVFTPPKWPGQNLTRDPSIVYHDGVFHMVWTSHWTGRIFGYASSKNLADWSEPIQVRPFSESLPNDDQPDNVWAPEIHHDPVKNDFFILFASTTAREKRDDDASNNNGKPGSQYDNRVFITRTRDFKTFSDAKLYFDRGFASIDAVMKPDPAHKNWVMIIKCSRDESLKTMPGRNLWITRSTGLDTDRPDFAPLVGPIAGNHSSMFCDPSPRNSMAEGPSLLLHNKLWWLVWDEPAGGHLQLATSPDLKTWTHRKDAKFPTRAQHGTLFLAPKSSVAWLKRNGATPSVEVPLLKEISNTESTGTTTPHPVDLHGKATTGSSYRSWRNARIDGGGFVSGMIASKAAGGSLFARTDVGGAYRWLSSTKNWLPITDELGPCQVESMAADPVDPRLVYVATSGRICRSPDLGRTWTIHQIPARMAGNGDGRCVGERLAIDPNSTNILFFGSRKDGLLASQDSGATWIKVPGFKDLKGEIGVAFVLFDPETGGKGEASKTIFLGVDGEKAAFYRSDDGGMSWNAVAGQPHGMFPNHAVLSPDRNLYLSYANQGGPNGMTDGAVWRYHTKGRGADAWKEISPVDPGKGSGDFFGYGSVALHPADPKVVIVAAMDRWNWGAAMWRTDDATAENPVWYELFSNKVKPKWTSPAPYKARDTHWISDIEFNPSQPDQMFFSFGLGVQRTDRLSAGAHAEWTFSAQGLEETVVLALASPASGPPLISGLGDIGGFTHSNLDDSPEVQHSGGNTTGIDFAALAPGIMARVGSKPGKISIDGGKTWSPFPSQEPVGGGRIAISANGRTMVWMSDKGAFFSSDHGTRWQPVSTLPQGSQIASDRVNPLKFYGYFSKDGKFFTSADGGVTFHLSDARLPGTHGYLRSAMRPVPGFEGHVFLTTQNWKQLSCLHKSTDSGKTFVLVSGMNQAEQSIGENKSVRSIRSFGFGKAMPGRRYPALYLSGRLNPPFGVEMEALYRSDDGGSSWIRINDDKNNFPADVLVGDSRMPGRIYVGTPGRGIIYGDP